MTLLESVIGSFPIRPVAHVVLLDLEGLSAGQGEQRGKRENPF